MSADATGPAPTPFENTLANLERSLLTPVIAGEERGWLDEARRNCARAHADLARVAAKDRTAIAQIGAQDPALLPRVAQLEQEERDLATRADALVAAADRASASAPATAAAGDARAQLEELAEVGVRFVVDARRLRTAIRTWLQESMNRDRGIPG